MAFVLCCGYFIKVRKKVVKCIYHVLCYKHLECWDNTSRSWKSQAQDSIDSTLYIIWKGAFVYWAPMDTSLVAEWATLYK